MTTRLGLLADRDFRLLWIGETTSSFGSSVSAFALPLVALEVLHAGAFTVAAIAAVAWLPWLLVGLPAGALVDRLPRRVVMMTADVVSIAAFGSVVLAVVAGALTTVHLLVAALVAGAATVFFSTAYRAYLPALVAAPDLLEANAKLQGSQQVTNVAGPGAAGVIVAAFRAAGGVLVDVVSFVVSLACLTRIRTVEKAPARQRRSLRNDIATGLRLAFADPMLRVNAIFGCLSNFMLTGYQAILLVFLVTTVHIAPGTAGVLLALASVGGVVGAAFARRIARVFGSARGWLICKLGLAPFGLLIPLTTNGAGVTLFVLGSMAMIGGIVAGNVIWSGFVQTYYPSDMLGRITTSIQFVNFGAIPLGALTAGALAAALDPRTALWIMLAGVAASGCVLLLSPVRRMRDLPTAAQVAERELAPAA